MNSYHRLVMIVLWSCNALAAVVFMCRELWKMSLLISLTAVSLSAQTSSGIWFATDDTYLSAGDNSPNGDNQFLDARYNTVVQSPVDWIMIRWPVISPPVGTIQNAYCVLEVWDHTDALTCAPFAGRIESPADWDEGTLDWEEAGQQIPNATDLQFCVLTYYGDSDLDGDVDAADLNTNGINWQKTGMSWKDGDFTGDGKVDAADLNWIGINWQKSMDDPGALADVLYVNLQPYIESWLSGTNDGILIEACLGYVTLLSKEDFEANTRMRFQVKQ